MGTSGLLGYIIAGKRRAAYNHHDSYPTGLGQDIVKFLNSLDAEDYDMMDKLVHELNWIDVESSDRAAPSSELQDKYTRLGYLDLNVSAGSAEDWYCLLRGVQGADALPAIKNGDLKHLVDAETEKADLSFAWSYYIDFANRTLTTYMGSKEIDTTDFENLKELRERYMELLEADCYRDD